MSMSRGGQPMRAALGFAPPKNSSISSHVNMLAGALLSEEVQRRRLHAFLYDCEAGLFEQRPPSRRIRTRMVRDRRREHRCQPVGIDDQDQELTARLEDTRHFRYAFHEIVSSEMVDRV